MWVSVAASCRLLVLGLFHYVASFYMNIGISFMNEFQFEKKKKLATFWDTEIGGCVKKLQLLPWQIHNYSYGKSMAKKMDRSDAGNNSVGGLCIFCLRNLLASDIFFQNTFNFLPYQFSQNIFILTQSPISASCKRTGLQCKLPTFTDLFSGDCWVFFFWQPGDYWVKLFFFCLSKLNMQSNKPWVISTNIWFKFSKKKRVLIFDEVASRWELHINLP